MKLKSIEIINFRRFYGSQTIEFSVDDEKSWTFVHAENGTGKSNFLSAINWVLYGELTKGSENPDNIINTTHALEKKQLAYAEVKLEILTDENKSLRLIRKITKRLQILSLKHTGLMILEILKRYLKVCMKVS